MKRNILNNIMACVKQPYVLIGAGIGITIVAVKAITDITNSHTNNKQKNKKKCKKHKK